MDWLSNLTGQDRSGAVELVLLVIGLALLLILLVWGVRKLAAAPERRAARNRIKRLSITDLAKVDDKRHLVLVRRDNVEHLLLIGGSTDIVVEQSIIRVQRKETPKPVTAKPPQTPMAVGSPSLANDAEPEPTKQLITEPEKTSNALSAPLAVASVAVSGATLGSFLETENAQPSTDGLSSDPVIGQSKLDEQTANSVSLVQEETSLDLDLVPLEGPQPEPTVDLETPEVVADKDVTVDPAISVEPQNTTTQDASIQFDESTLEESLESVLAADMSAPITETIEEAEPVPAMQTSPSPKPFEASTDKGVDDEMQRLLEELAGETSEKR